MKANCSLKLLYIIAISSSQEIVYTVFQSNQSQVA
jgi:hypothetical protein